jgi:hypothetical protein
VAVVFFVVVFFFSSFVLYEDASAGERPAGWRPGSVTRFRPAA